MNNNVLQVWYRFADGTSVEGGYAVGCNELPAVGDVITIRGIDYKVIRRKWELREYYNGSRGHDVVIYVTHTMQGD